MNVPRFFQTFRFRMILLIVLLVGVVTVFYALTILTFVERGLRDQEMLRLTNNAYEFGPHLVQTLTGEGRPPVADDRERRDPRRELALRGIDYVFLNEAGEVIAQSGEIALADLRPRIGTMLGNLPDFPGRGRGRGSGPGPGPGRAHFPGRGPGPPPHLDFELSQSIVRGEEPREEIVQLIPTSAGVLVLAMPVQNLHQDLARVRNAFLMAIPVALLLAFAGAWLVSDRAVRPVNRLRDSAAAITAEDLDTRLDPKSADREFAELITVYNQMLDRLERSFLQARRFSADAAHELNTPITILQGHLDDALQNAPADSADQRRYALLLEETQRLGEIVRKLLLLSRADTGRLAVENQAVALHDLLGELLDDLQTEAQSAGVSVCSRLEPVTVQGDPGLLRQAFFNLLSNALKYNRPEGEIRVTLQPDPGAEPARPRAVIEITNTGEPIPAEHVPRLFERFFRADPSRTRKSATPGLGLGLSLAREFLHVHGGEISLSRNEPDHVSFRIHLRKTQ